MRVAPANRPYQSAGLQAWRKLARVQEAVRLRWLVMVRRVLVISMSPGCLGQSMGSILGASGVVSRGFVKIIEKSFRQGCQRLRRDLGRLWVRVRSAIGGEGVVLGRFGAK